MNGDVKKFADIKPKFARLTGETGEKIEVDITIVPEKGYPFKIKKVKARNTDFIKYTLVEPDEKNPNRYLLHIENTKSDAGRYSDYIELHTDSKVQPVLTIGVYGYIREKAVDKSSPKKPGKKGTD